MAQTIKIKRSSSAINPSNLKEGELAYIHSSDTAGKLYIGRPGTGDANTGIASSIDIIGGLLDHDKLNGIEANADVTDTANVTAAGALMDSEVTNLAQVKAFDSSEYATSAQGTKADTAEGWGNHASAGYLTAHQDITGKADLSGADFTGSVGIADGIRLNFGASDDLTLYHDDTTGSSFIKETGTGSLAIQGDNLILSDINSSMYLFGVSGGATRIYYDGSTKLTTRDDGVGVTGDLSATGTLATGGYTLASTDGTNGQALVTDGSGNVSFGDVTVDVSGKADLSGATFTGDIIAKSKLIVNKQPVASDLLTTSRSIQDLAAWAVYVNTTANYALTPEKYRDAFDVNQDNQFSAADAYAITLFVQSNYTGAESNTYNSLVGNPSNITSTFVQDVIDGDFDTDGVIIDGDASSIVTVNGDITVSGDLTVSGTTTTVNTETINLADNIIELNSNVGANNATQNAGLEVNRGNYTNVKLFWDETNHDWRVDAVGDVATAATTSPLLTAGNFETKITELDGGTFS